jgi:hypothetical protein
LTINTASFVLVSQNTNYDLEGSVDEGSHLAPPTTSTCCATRLQTAGLIIDLFDSSGSRSQLQRLQLNHSQAKCQF